MLPVFYRSDFSQLWLKLSSSETLGILDTDYIEDEEGIDSQLTLVHLATEQRWALTMLPTGDPPVHSTFQTVVLLASVPDGDYEIRGRVRDLVGNYTVLNSTHFGGSGEVEALGFTLATGRGWSIHLPGLELVGGYVLDPLAMPGPLPSLLVTPGTLAGLTRLLPALTPISSTLPVLGPVAVTEGIYG